MIVMIDHDDCVRMRELCLKYNKLVAMHNEVIAETNEKEIHLDLGIIKNDISSSITWKKQVIELIKKAPEYETTYIEYKHGLVKEKATLKTMKACEGEINCLKKTIDLIGQT